MKKYNLSLFVLASSISVVFAISGADLYQNVMVAIFQPIIRGLIAIAVLYFLFGVLKFIWAAREGKEDEMNKGKMHLLWGTVGLFIMLSIGGILKALNSMIGGSLFS